MRPVAALGFGLLGLLLPALATARPAPVDSRVILGFDRQPETWIIIGTTRALRSQQAPIWSLTGRVRCHGDACPGRRARIRGIVQVPGGVLQATARFACGTTCSFAGMIEEPSAPGEILCTDREGRITLQRPLHVGVCRCGVRRGAGFCAARPCPGPF
jgi:hypothetical protein